MSIISHSICIGPKGILLETGPSWGCNRHGLSSQLIEEMWWELFPSDSQQSPETMPLRNAEKLPDILLPLDRYETSLWASVSPSVKLERGSGNWMRSQRAWQFLTSCGLPSTSTRDRPNLFLTLEWAWLNPITEPLPKLFCNICPLHPLEHYSCTSLLVLVWISDLWSHAIQNTLVQSA